MLMTKEEAAEEILVGPWRTCIHCDGKGWSLKGAKWEEPFDPNKTIYNLPQCSSCKGVGKWLRGDYRSACAILGLDCPSTPYDEISIEMKVDT
jgi:hypothetical protein